VVRDPVQRRVREDGVERLAGLVLGRVDALEAEVGVALPRLGDHLLGAVDSDDVAVVDLFRELGGEVSRPAPEVEDALLRFRVQQVDQALAVLVDEAVVGVVGVGVPVVASGHDRSTRRQAG